MVLDSMFLVWSKSYRFSYEEGTFIIGYRIPDLLRYVLSFFSFHEQSEDRVANRASHKVLSNNVTLFEWVSWALRSPSRTPTSKWTPRVRPLQGLTPVSSRFLRTFSSGPTSTEDGRSPRVVPERNPTPPMSGFPGSAGR